MQYFGMFITLQGGLAVSDHPSTVFTAPLLPGVLLWLGAESTRRLQGSRVASPLPVPQREDAAENSREPTAPPAVRVTVQEAARILETGANALLEAIYKVIADLSDGGSLTMALAGQPQSHVKEQPPRLFSRQCLEARFS
jgi:hypothetical protein